MKALTNKEEEVMKNLWNIERGFVKDILTAYASEEEPPHYNTLSTMVRNLEEKGFVSHKAYGKTHEYFPLISKEAYRAVYMDKAISDFFSDSYSHLVSQFAAEEKISVAELKEIIAIIENK
jgi:BlaI family penicillinase repressor